MRQKNVNRFVWANGFTNDKTAFCNKEAYQKRCDKCNKKIWLSPTGTGWKAINEDGKPHECRKTDKLKLPKNYKKACKFCGKPIVVILQSKKKWVAYNENRSKHRCGQ